MKYILQTWLDGEWDGIFPNALEDKISKSVLSEISNMRQDAAKKAVEVILGVFKFDIKRILDDKNTGEEKREFLDLQKDLLNKEKQTNLAEFVEMKDGRPHPYILTGSDYNKITDFWQKFNDAEHITGYKEIPGVKLPTILRMKILEEKINYIKLLQEGKPENYNMLNGYFVTKLTEYFVHKKFLSDTDKSKFNLWLKRQVPGSPIQIHTSAEQFVIVIGTLWDNRKLTAAKKDLYSYILRSFKFPQGLTESTVAKYLRPTHRKNNKIEIFEELEDFMRGT